MFCKDRNTGYNLRENDTQDLVPNFGGTNGLKSIFFNSTVNDWNGLHVHRETNSIATFKKKVLSFIKDFILNKIDFIKIQSPLNHFF